MNEGMSFIGEDGTNLTELIKNKALINNDWKVLHKFDIDHEKPAFEEEDSFDAVLDEDDEYGEEYQYTKLQQPGEEPEFSRYVDDQDYEQSHQIEPLTET